MRSRSQRFSAALLFLATISAALPVVRFCPLAWDEIDLATYAACSAMPVTGECRATSPAVPAANSTKTARTIVSPHCVAMATCPMRERAGHSAPGCGTCDATTSTTASPEPQLDPSCASGSGAQPGTSRRAPKHHAGPGWCFADPLIAAATRAHPPTAPAPLAIAAAIVAIEVPATVPSLVPETDARPPTPPPLARPTIRGPPLLLG